MSRLQWCYVAVMGALLVFAAPAFAQFNASIQGTVADPTGAVVPGANVTVTNKATGVATTATTDSAGLYRVDHLQPGSYTVSVTSPSFKQSVSDNVQVLAETPRGLNVTLQPGEAAQQVTVTAGNEQLQTETANNQATIGVREVLEIPQTGRDPYELLRTVPGVFGTGARQANGNAIALPQQVGPNGSASQIFQTENQVQVTANGQRVSANHYLVDGVQVDSLGNGGSAVITPNQESISEITAVAGTYDAQDGRNSGLITKTVSKNGTNNLHGTGVILFADPGLNAFNKFYGPIPAAGAKPIPCTSGSTTFMVLASQCPERSEQKYRQFAGSIGGPIVKDHLFFFFSYEGVRLQNSVLQRSVIMETPQFEQYVKQVNPSSIAAKIFSLPGITPRISTPTTTPCSSTTTTNCVVDCCSLDGRALGTWYQPGIGIGQAIGNGPDGIPDWGKFDLRIPNSSRGNQFNGRLDYNQGKNQFFFDTYYTLLDNLNGGNRPITDLAFSPNNWTAAVGWTRIISNSLINDLRGNVTRFTFNQETGSSGTNFGLPQIGIFDFDANGFGDQSRNGFLGLVSSATTPGKLAENTFDLRDTLTWVFGRHALKLGGDAIREQNNDDESGADRPFYQFRGLLNFANDACCFNEQVTVNPQTGGPANGLRHFRTSDYAAFAQDTWKLRRNLTLTLGLRWEYFTPLTEVNNLMTNYVVGATTVGGLKCVNYFPGACAGAVTPSTQLYNPDRNNFGPKIGFAWSPSDTAGNLVLRGGFGISYNRDMGIVFSNVRQNSTPLQAAAQACCFFDPGRIQGPPPGSNILYSLGSSNSAFSYPFNPGLSFGVAPDGALCAVPGCASVVKTDLFGALPSEPNPYIYSYSLDMQEAFTHSDTFKVGYYGSRSRRLVRTIDLNRITPGDTFDGTMDETMNASANGTACGASNPACPAAVAVGNNRFFRIFFPLPDVNASYDALITNFTHQAKYGLTFSGSYTWSHTIDTASYDIGGQQFEPSNPVLNKANSDFDARNYFQLAAVWDLPIFRGRHDLLGTALGGWTISTIATHNSGFPFTADIGTCDTNHDRNGDSFCPDYPFAYFGGVIQSPSKQQFINGIFPNPTAEFDTTTKGPGCRCRNIFTGPGYSDVDLSLAKSFTFGKLPVFGEGARVELRGDAFNALNILNLSPFAPATTPTDIINKGAFGKANSAGAGRVIQLQARIQF
jgi:hypothetical protein